MHCRMVRYSVILALFVSVSVNAAQPQVVVLEPRNNWELNYSSERCRLTRGFGNEADGIDLTFERFEPGVQFRFIVGGKPLRNHLRAKQANVRFGPTEANQELAFQGGTGGGSVPLWIFAGSTRIAPQPDSADDIRFITPEREAAVTHIEIGKPLGKTYRLQTGSLGPAFAALRKCTDDVLAHWGYDVAKHRTMTRRPMPLDGGPGDWVRGRDYPDGALAAGVNGLVEFRLDVDELGNATACHIQKTVRTVGFADAVCSSIMKRARFAPALDADGKPMRSYWRNTVRFEVG
jgi:hypothetical protein